MPEAAHSQPRMLRESTAELTDAELLRAAKSGDQKAFRALHDKYRAIVREQARLLCRNQIDRAEDLTQETFARAFTNLELFDVGSFQNFILKILTNLFNTQYQKRVYQAERHHQVEQVYEETMQGETLPSPLEAVIARQETSSVEERHQALLNWFSKKYASDLLAQTIFRLHFIEQKPEVEVVRIVRGLPEFRHLTAAGVRSKFYRVYRKAENEMRRLKMEEWKNQTAANNGNARRKARRDN